MNDVMVEYIDLYKAFDHPVLAGVTLDVGRGETISVVGHSGTGKSVLLKNTIGLIVPDAGDVVIDGQSVVRADRRQLARIRKKVGYVFQNAALFDSMSVFENVAQGLSDEEQKELGTKALLAKVAEALELVNLTPRKVLSKLPSELSGGMRKRVGIARAIVGRPEILLYDEPVTGLDPVNGTVVHRLIDQLSTELGVTSIIVTHDIEGTLPISDRVAMLDHGRIRFVGTADEFRNSTDALVRAFLERDVPDTDDLLEPV
ncbi:ATP-binding cassette domain-containing protein [Longimicrobium terrae]|uniref:Phospholipid/cholesterol/gamma-HCH transport system ATP-binding protein n=1 Tax=Longimicrobium terrae TaxID=1639882 RepID=A0A841H0N6_9BACT|nr:phospholipid/cholesterol/gamma-HCH transport system ATP-binding protein [Longimicrobium terrae]MBB6071573.1 phospholipid/cholesterol/gamma-HCH transport system ATP-binding protein [Longimicrobium terrae]NNC30008.1 ATP-binding cassette domain-containing protein [Longimicrobium terrae]